MSARLLQCFLPIAVPMAARWVAEQERHILLKGEPLGSDQLRDARQAGVRHPESIRVQYVDAIPMPAHRSLIVLGRWTGLVSPGTAGITLGYGIYIRIPDRTDRHLLVHECVHVGQYERHGSIAAFLRPYLAECLDPGYPRGPMEQEAILRAAQLVKQD